MNNTEETLSEKLKRLEHEEMMKNPNYREWYERQQELKKQAAEQYENQREKTLKLIAELGFVKNNTES